MRQLTFSWESSPSNSEPKQRGAFFTPSALSEYICNWAIRSSGDRVLEPSCGEAAFLEAALGRLRAIGASELGQDQVVGVELHEESVWRAHSAIAQLGLGPCTLRLGDFFDHTDLQGFDAVVGNPPYIRYQDFGGTARAKAQRAALAEGVRLPGLASSWAAFVVKAASSLTTGGRLGLVLPAELLSVNYAAPVRSYLMRRFGRVRLVLFEERVFPHVLEEVVLLLAEGTGPTDKCELMQVRSLTDLATGTSRRWSPIPADSKWIPGLLDPIHLERYEDVAKGAGFHELRNWGQIDLGIVTGNNSFFVLSDEAVARHGISETDLKPICPPGSRHLRGLSFTEAARQELAAEGRPSHLFYPSAPLSGAALNYVRDGEARRIHDAYKCRVRSPWWRVPLVSVPDLFVTYMNHDSPRLVSNDAKLLHLNSVHGIKLAPKLRPVGRDLLPIASLNSLTLLSAELVGRSYGGGMLKLEPKEADRLIVPTPSAIASVAEQLRALRPQLGRQLRQGSLAEAASRVDQILLKDGLGVRPDVVNALRDARRYLFARRDARGAGPA